MSNDFTKEELEELASGMTWIYSEQVGCSSDDTLKLWRDIEVKLKSMIDNYCEHKCNGEIEIFVDTCSKCNAYLLRNLHHDNQ